jgi:hypothetical protein
MRDLKFCEAADAKPTSNVLPEKGRAGRASRVLKKLLYRSLTVAAQ